MIYKNNKKAINVYNINYFIKKIYKDNDLKFERTYIINPSDIALYDYQTKKELIISFLSYNTINYPITRFRPIGIVVIPANVSKELYPDGHQCKGKPVIMSLNYMRFDTPDVGGNIQKMLWNNNNTNGVLKKFPSCAQITNTSVDENVTEYQIKPLTSGTHLPSSKILSKQECIVAPKLYYVSTTLMHCSPVIFNYKNGKVDLNPQYKNAPTTCSCTDVDGISNTNNIIKNIDDENWKTSNEILCDKYNEINSYPAASCCWRYHIDGIDNQGDWYLPALGELCFIMPFYKEHNESLEKIINIYKNNISVLLEDMINHWSSTEVSNSGAWAVHTQYGLVNGNIAKTNEFGVRAFRPLKV